MTRFLAGTAFAGADRVDAGRLRAAASGLEAYLGLVPDDAAVRQDLAQVYEALGRYADAAACYEAIYAQYPQQDVYHLEALRCQLLAG